MLYSMIPLLCTPSSLAHLYLIDCINALSSDLMFSEYMDFTAVYQIKYIRSVYTFLGQSVVCTFLCHNLYL